MTGTLQSKFNKLIESQQLQEAIAFFKEEIKKAEFIDPRDDYSWGPASDVLGFKILEQKGPKAFGSYWEEMLQFFVEELEPHWGHLHKGHIFFRLSSAYYGEDKEKAVDFIEKALEEDRLVAASMSQDLHLDKKRIVEKFPSYIALCILERIPPEYFPSDKARQHFYEGLISLRFDVIWDKKEIEPSLVTYALEHILPKEIQAEAQQLCDEMNRATAQGLATTTLSLLGTLVEMMLFGILSSRYGVKEIDGRSILYADMGQLLKAGMQKEIFPTPTVQSLCQMIHILTRELNRKSDKTYEYECTSFVRFQIAYGVKILFDMVLVEWAKKL